MSEKYLLLYLDAPMQAWGYSSRFNRRTTASWPVKSGIIGLLCAAIGIEREDEAGIARLSALKMTVYTLKNEGRRLMDWHTVGGGYDPKTQRQNMSNKAGGGSPDTVLTDREYLLDCKFGVILSGDVATVEECAAALENPKWGVWFGRKCCLPAARICEGIFGSMDEALGRLQNIAEQNGWKANGWRRVREAENFEDGTDSMMDIPLNFSTRHYQTRRIADEVME
jgi:CRISPR system Cascade subunit CasD